MFFYNCYNKFVSCDILNGLDRHSKRLFVPFCKCKVRKISFTYRMLPIWNCLQNTTVRTNIYKCFINRLNDIDLSKHLRWSM